jgi:hypothetical protein
VRCDQAFLGPTISPRWEDGRSGGHKFEHAQQASCDFDVPLIAGMMEGDQDLVGQAPGVARRASVGILVIGGPFADCAVVGDPVPNNTNNGVRIAHQTTPPSQLAFSMITKKHSKTLNIRYFVPPAGVNLRKRSTPSRDFIVSDIFNRRSDLEQGAVS